jgi:hypothetical protein
MKSYEKPRVTVVGSFQELTTVSVSQNKYSTTTPDGVLYHPSSTTTVVLAS